MWLHSARSDERWARWSLIGEPDQQPMIIQHDQTDACVFEDLDQALTQDNALYIGWLSYDLGRCVETLPSLANDEMRWPLIYLARCPGFATFDNLHQQWRLHGTWQQAPPRVFTQDPGNFQEPSGFHATLTTQNMTSDEYRTRVQSVRNYIAAGDVFQVNLARRQDFTYTGQPRHLSLELAESSPAWYAGHLEAILPDRDRHVIMCAASPELFLEVGPDRLVTTRPMKGTRPAGMDASLLRDSEKDQAELNMIVDLMRNDLGRVCEVGSIKVNQPREIEHHPTVHQAVATIQGRLHASHSLGDLLRATMPGGSITGAPKVRAMQIIEELEPTRRGAYCGAYGWMRGGRMSLGMTIRTALLEHDQVEQRGRGHLHIGAGIVADSDPKAEYIETQDKAAAMLRAFERLKRKC